MEEILYYTGEFDKLFSFGFFQIKGMIDSGWEAHGALHITEDREICVEAGDGHEGISDYNANKIMLTIFELTKCGLIEKR